MKPGSFTQLYVQLVFAVQYRENLLVKSIRPHIFEYIGGIIKGMKHKALIVNGVADHVHILLGLNPSVSISDTVHDIKRSSSLFINNNNLISGRFSWQSGYGAFSYSRTQIENVFRYIQNQEIHHARTSFRQEYISLLEKNDIEYDPRYIFEFL